jgi:hypothetical protein
MTSINKILRQPKYRRNCARGAPLGAVNFVSEGVDEDRPLRCQRVYLVDGDYGPDGTYWGASEKAGHIYCAFNDGQDGDPYAPAMGVRLYTRAWTYGQAKAEFTRKYPTIKFLRGGR